MNRMRKKITIICSAALVLVASGCSSSKKASREVSALPRELEAVAQAVEPETKRGAERILSNTVSLYQPWEEVSIDGKISMEGLPLDPTAKIYMKRDREVIVSVRAPILGEVARVEIADGEILVANRMKKIYVRESMDKVLSYVDFSLTDVQDVFLGRVFVLGKGTLSGHNSKDMTVALSPSDSYIVTPVRQPSSALYGFTLYSDYRMQLLYARSPDYRYKANAEYTWRSTDGAKDVALDIIVGERDYPVEFRFKAPDFSPKAMSRMALNDKWKKVSIREFLQSI